MNKITYLFLILIFTFNNCTGRGEKTIHNKGDIHEDSSTLIIINLKKMMLLYSIIKTTLET
jgi:hypothetical protein